MACAGERPRVGDVPHQRDRVRDAAQDDDGRAAPCLMPFALRLCERAALALHLDKLRSPAEADEQVRATLADRVEVDDARAHLAERVHNIGLVQIGFRSAAHGQPRRKAPDAEAPGEVDRETGGLPAAGRGW